MKNSELRILVFVISAFLVASNVSQGQSWRVRVGWTALSNELGTALEDGTGVVVSQVEAPVSGGGYRTNAGNSAFLNPDKNFIILSPPNPNNSGHATTVGRSFYGNGISLAEGVIDVNVYEANNWVNGATGLSGSQNPQSQPFAVQNHSWIGDAPDSQSQNILQRVDYMVNESDFSLVAGTNNSGITPDLLVHGFNSISVGKTNGNHASGLTRFYISGRVKPEIVAPSHSATNDNAGTSFRAPMVGGTAAMLRQAGSGSNADNNEAVKAMIMAGATKVEFNNWQNTPTVPLDTTFGVGELNTYNSYRIFQAGETDGELTTPAVPTGMLGWDYGTSLPGQSLNYLIELPEPVDHLSIALTWNIQITDTNSSPDVFQPSFDLPDLDLLAAGKGIVQFSQSNNHNVEHIYLRDLPAGVYNIVILPDSSSSVDFALAWRAAPITETGLEQFNVLTGSNANGSLDEMAESDDVYFELSVAKVAPPDYAMVMEFESTCPVNMPNSIQFDLEANVNTPNVEQKIEIFNFTDGQYEPFDVSSASYSDSVFTGYLHGEPFEFIDPSTSTIRARVSWKQTGPVLVYPWTARIDKAAWSISQ